MTTQDGSKTIQDDPRQSQDAPKTAQDPSKTTLLYLTAGGASLLEGLGAVSGDIGPRLAAPEVDLGGS